MSLPLKYSKNSSDKEDSILRGTIRRVTYRNNENNYSVIQLEEDKTKKIITVVGYCLTYPHGAQLLINGALQEHDKFGEQFLAKSAHEIEPDTADGIRLYLSSGFFAGVGEKTAEKIVNALGVETLNIIKNEPETAARTPGLKSAVIYSIHNQLVEKKEIANTEKFFAEHGISRNLIEKILEKFKKNAIEIVNRDPYILAYKIRGIGFSTADAIAIKLGFQVDSPARLRAGLYYALQKAQDDGHCYLEEEELFSQTYKLLNIHPEQSLHLALEELCNYGYAQREDDFIYLRRLYKAEIYVANFIKNLAQKKLPPLIPPDKTNFLLEQVEKELQINFSLEQKRGVELLINQAFLIVTGGPGCGKTTLIRALSRVLMVSGANFALAAPTGKAAQRMSEVSGIEAKTIHRLLKYNPHTDSFMYHEQEKLKLDESGKEIDALIIDEASMLDIALCHDLFQSLPDGCRLILVGDKDQLPSVGPGRVFADLVSIHNLPIVSLSQLFRRGEASRITYTAHSINSGTVPEIPQPDGGNTKTDAYFIERNDAHEAARLIESLFCEQVTQKFGIAQEQITILTPMNRGTLGTQQLNKAIQARLHTEQNDEEKITVHELDFRIGDRVCQRVNNYNIDELGVFNGDIGIISQIDTENGSATVTLWDERKITYQKKDLHQLSLSYAMTIHRSQGSEIPCVIMCLHESHYTLLERQLLYTGVTRAKKLLIIVGSKKAFEMACRKMSTKKRKSNLKFRIVKL